jgi:hypothetical protein
VLRLDGSPGHLRRRVRQLPVRPRRGGRRGGVPGGCGPLRVCGYSRAVLWEVEERVIFQRRIACSAASFLRFRDAKEA